MPRRLGDDPLARAKNAAAVQAARAMQTSGAPMLAPRGSQNDVFFETRTAEVSPFPSAPTPEGPEISEVSSLPQIREAATDQAAAQSQQQQSPAVPARSYLEELVSNLNSSQAAPAKQAEAKPEGQTPQSGSFFRRLFGKR